MEVDHAVTTNVHGMRFDRRIDMDAGDRFHRLAAVLPKLQRGQTRISVEDGRAEEHFRNGADRTPAEVEAAQQPRPFPGRQTDKKNALTLRIARAELSAEEQ